ncbi:hypothetical protein EVAR_61495_1 [Eumeta japonica]|uniref:Uncharacterized protein n=1 Tax=Eumeta variegata TaxID=151549 RepID=A0A4C1ZYR8_EUMVA|nr:hypothetical protein EVAR_61495_1 [Eumeta japonica]
MIWPTWLQKENGPGLIVTFYTFTEYGGEAAAFAVAFYPASKSSGGPIPISYSLLEIPECSKRNQVKVIGKKVDTLTASPGARRESEANKRYRIRLIVTARNDNDYFNDYPIG